MKKLSLKKGVSRTSFFALLLRARQVKKLLTDNVGLYPTPNPTLVQLATHITALQDANAKWSADKTRGSKADYAALLVAATDVTNDLTLLSAYVQNTEVSPTQARKLRALIASGFAVNNVPSKEDMMAPVSNVYFIKKKNVVEPQVYIKWKKPKELLTGTEVKSYSVYKNGTFMRSQTTTSLTVTRPTGAAEDVYGICAVGTKGEGPLTKIKVSGSGI